MQTHESNVVVDLSLEAAERSAIKFSSVMCHIVRVHQPVKYLPQASTNIMHHKRE